MNTILINTISFDNFIIKNYHIVGIKFWGYILIFLCILSIIAFATIFSRNHENGKIDTFDKICICSILICICCCTVYTRICCESDYNYQNAVVKTNEYTTTNNIVSISLPDKIEKNYNCLIINDDKEVESVLIPFDSTNWTKDKSSYAILKYEDIKYPNGDIKTIIKSADMHITDNVISKDTNNNINTDNNKAHTKSTIKLIILIVIIIMSITVFVNRILSLPQNK